MVFTDPPYNIDTGGGSTGFHGKMQRLMNNIEHLSNFNPEKFLEILYSKIFSHGEMNAYVFCNDALIPEYMLSARQNGCRCSVLVWDKGHAFPISNAHRPDIEYLIFIRKNAIWNSGLKDADYSKVLRYSHEFANEKNGNHPTVKPVELIANELKISSNEFSVVVDMFGGSGSTLIACEQLGRKCYMMELDPHYCDVIIDRWEKLTGEEAVRL